MLLPLAKADGVIPFLCIVAATTPAVIEERSWKAGIWALAPGATVAVGWATLMRILGVPKESDFESFSPGVLLAHLARAGQLLGWTLKELTQWKHWSLLWLLVVLALATLGARTPWRRWYPWAAAVGLPLCLYPCVYFFSAWNPIEPHIESSIPRLFLQIA